jgi:hypothetical protein
MAGGLISQVVPSVVSVAAAALAFGGCAWLFAAAFRRRSGSLYRFKLWGG